MENLYIGKQHQSEERLFTIDTRTYKPRQVLIRSPTTVYPSHDMFKKKDVRLSRTDKKARARRAIQNDDSFSKLSTDLISVSIKKTNTNRVETQLPKMREPNARYSLKKE